MLVLGLKDRERVLIGDEIEIIVTLIGPHKVRLGIEAPKELRISRAKPRAFGEGRDDGKEACDDEKRQTKGKPKGQTWGGYRTA